MSRTHASWGSLVAALLLLSAGGTHALIASGIHDSELSWVAAAEWALAGLALLGALAFARGWWLGRALAAIFCLASVVMLLVGIGLLSHSFEELGPTSPSPSPSVARP
jgi:hypothetical protein